MTKDVRKALVISISLLLLCGCANPYEKAVRKSLEGWKYWQENYYIQKINTYEILAPYYIQGIPYVEVYVRVVNKYNPYEYTLFNFFVRKDYPDSIGIPNNQEWREWNKTVQIKLIEKLQENFKCQNL